MHKLYLVAGHGIAGLDKDRMFQSGKDDQSGMWHGIIDQRVQAGIAATIKFTGDDQGGCGTS